MGTFCATLSKTLPKSDIMKTRMPKKRHPSHPTSLSSELRKDYIQEKYVIIAPHRGARPHDFKTDRPRISKNVSCVFCPQNINHQPALLTIGKPDRWDVKVIANKFPAVSLENPKAYGTQEVIIETPDHHLAFEDLSVARIAKLLEIYAMRTRAISENPQNSLPPHLQKYRRARWGIPSARPLPNFATSFSPRIFSINRKVQEYKLRNGTCVYCDVIQEERSGPRFVWEDQHTLAFTPTPPCTTTKSGSCQNAISTTSPSSPP